MKKVLSIALSVLLISSLLISCGGKKEEPAPAPAPAAPAPVEKKAEAKPVEKKEVKKEEKKEKKQKAAPEKVLVIGVPANFEEKWNPLMAESAYDQQVIEQIFTAPQQVNEKNEMVDFAGSITYELTDDGGIIYTVKCNEGMTFSDGHPVTIDDYLYGLYVTADPSYTGPVTLRAEDIDGMQEYFYDNPNISEIQRIAKENYSLETISQEDFITYLMETGLEGAWDGNPNGDPWGVPWPVYLTDYCGMGEELKSIDANDPEQMLYLLAVAEYMTAADAYDPQSWWTAKLNQEMGLDQKVETIRGIKKVDDYTATIKYNSVNIYGDRAINSYFVPAHYYGEFEKGDVSAIISNMVPMGSGPYKWVGFSDNIATCVANDDYFEGVPKIKTVKWQFVPEADTIPSLASGAIDIANPSGNKDNLQSLKDFGLEYDLVDFAGYGYCGFNAKNMDLNTRKGLWCLFSNRTPAVKGYYGDIASVIERPMTSVLAEYPHDAEQYYPYSREEAMKYFTKAGWELVDGKLMRDGEKLVVNVYIGGSGVGDHPTYALLVQVAEDLKALGGELQIQDVDFNVLQSAMNDGTADIFTLAWGNVTTCDKMSQFHSQGGQNRYGIADARMDNLLEEIIVTVDLEQRKALVAEMLDLAMDLCIELPVYQRKDIIAYNPQNVNMDTIPETTTFWQYKNQLWKVELN